MLYSRKRHLPQGIGLYDELPRVLRSNVPINNK